MEKKNNPALIKYLWENEGLPIKIISIISGSKQPYVSKVIGGTLQPNVAAAKVMDAEQKEKYDAIRHILDTIGDYYFINIYNCILYMHLLKFLLVPKEKIKEKLFDNEISNRKFMTFFSYKGLDITQFDSKNIEIERETFLKIVKKV